jgi:hypothetical protein
MVSIGKGDGVTTNFAGVLDNKPVLPTSTVISSVDVLGAAISMYFDTYLPAPLVGDLFKGDTLPATSFILTTTGALDITFTTAPANGQDIWLQAHQEPLGKPKAVFFGRDLFDFRPVPDQVYEVMLQTYSIPNALLDGAEFPSIIRWWEYIAYGAARKVFQDRMDLESLALIEPEFQKQETLVLRHTIMQSANDRAATVYTGLYPFDVYEKFGGI